MNGRTIRRRESNPDHRRILFTITDENGTPREGAIVDQVMISPYGQHWRQSRGTVVDLGQGWYSFTPTRDEIDFVGALAIDIPGHFTPNVHTYLTATIVPSDEHDEEQPSIYFTTKPDPRNPLDEMAENWGLSRQLGEDDVHFRRRIRAYLGNTQRGTLEDIREAIHAVPSVVRVVSVDPIDAGHVTMRVCTQVSHQSVRDDIESAIEATRPAGVIVDLELETPDGNEWA